VSRNEHRQNPLTPSAALAQSKFSGPAQPNMGVHCEDDPTIAARAAAAKSTDGKNPGNPPNRGLTAPGVVEAFINATLGAGAMGTSNSLPGRSASTDVMKKA
jgi:hypothetical protein